MTLPPGVPCIVLKTYTPACVIVSIDEHACRGSLCSLDHDCHVELVTLDPWAWINTFLTTLDISRYILVFSM